MAHLSFGFSSYPKIGAIKCNELDDFRVSLTQPTRQSRRLLFRYWLGVYDTFRAESLCERLGDVTFRTRHDASFLSEGQKPDSKIGWRRGTHERREKELLSLFADDPDAPFSIHRFVEHGALACGKHPGEWFGPSATARCIR